MNPSHQLKISKAKKNNLSKNQVTFNRLNNQIRKIKEEIESDKKGYDSVLHFYHKMLHPVQLGFGKVLLNLAKSIDSISKKIKLNGNENDYLGITIVDVFESAFIFVEPNEEEEKIYDRHSAFSYKEEIQFQAEQIKDMFSEIMETMGLDFDLSEFDLHSPEGMAILKEEFENKLKDEKSKKQDQNQSASQLKKELQLKQEDELKLKSIKSIYVSLAKLLHPDTEMDPAKKTEKTAIMQKVIKAYQDKDINALLQLEIDWLNTESGKIETLTEPQLKIYNKALSQQLFELQNEKEALAMHPRYSPISEFMGIPLKQAESAIFIETRATKLDEETAEKFIIILEKVNDKKEFLKALKRVQKFMMDNEFDLDEDFFDESVKNGKSKKR